MWYKIEGMHFCQRINWVPYLIYCRMGFFFFPPKSVTLKMKVAFEAEPSSACAVEQRREVHGEGHDGKEKGGHCSEHLCPCLLCVFCGLFLVLVGCLIFILISKCTAFLIAPILSHGTQAKSNQSSPWCEQRCSSQKMSKFQKFIWAAGLDNAEICCAVENTGKIWLTVKLSLNCEHVTSTCAP